MQRKFYTKLVLVLLVLFTLNVKAQHGDESHDNTHDTEHQEASGEIDVKAENKKVIQHHLLDDHDFTITHGVSFPLPVILWDGGLQVFMSSKFHHGTEVAEVNGNFYTTFHGKIYKTDAAGTITMDDHHHATNVKPLDLSITKNVFVIIFMALFMFFIFKKMAGAYSNGPMPKGAGRFLEPLVVFVRDEIAIPNIGKKHYKRYMSYLLTVFFLSGF